MSVAAEYFAEKPISPILEMGAYEYLWLQPTASFKSIAQRFKDNPKALASDLVDTASAKQTADDALKILYDANIRNVGIRLHHTNQYPAPLRDAKYPVEFFYFLGTGELMENPRSIAVVGARKASEDGIRRTRKLVKQLVEQNYTIVSGLAAGIDTAAHTTAIECGGNTIAVIGTPITDQYPKANKDLQAKIAREHLVISQVPILRYRQQDWRRNRLFFPERNKTMSALTKASVIVEAGETSGTLIQAKAAFEQGRKLFILDSCFHNPDITWPAKFEQQGAVRVKTIDDILQALDGE